MTLLFLAGTGFLSSLRQARSVGYSWAVIYAIILGVLALGRQRHDPRLTYVAAGLWALLILAPSLVAKLYHRLFLQGRYRAAYWVAMLVGALHPFGDWRRHPRVVKALGLAARGHADEAMESLKSFKDANSPIALSAMAHLFRLTGRWQEFLDWHYQRFGEDDEEFLPSLLRARGELGDVHGLANLFQQRREIIARMSPPTSRDFCRLGLYAFGGRRDLVERLLAGSLSILPAPIKSFWLATADMAAGETSRAHADLIALSAKANPSLRLAIKRRLAQSATLPAARDEFVASVVESAELDQVHDETFATRRTIFSRRAIGTQLIIAANVAMFAVELRLGGATDQYTLLRLGALKYSLLMDGQWWRMFAALFLHYGWPHIIMNMFALWTIGPFAEYALGFRRFMIVYFLCGLGSMAVVVRFGTEFIVGASGAIMGLVGATAALMLRGWLQAKADAARQRLTAVIMVLAMQTVFDALVPQISMTAHLSGAVIGFLLTMGLRNHLKAKLATSLSADSKGNSPKVRSRP